MEPTAEMRRKLHVAVRELTDRVALSLRSHDFSEEVKTDLCLRVGVYLWRLALLYASVPVPARSVYVEYVRRDLAVSRLVLSQSLGKSPRLSEGGGTAREEPSYALPDLTADEKNRVARALLQAEDALCASVAGLREREAEALAEAVDELLGIFDLAGAVVCS